MQFFKGMPVSGGLAQGNVVFIPPAIIPTVYQSGICTNDIPHNLERLHKALENSVSELEELQKRVIQEVGEAESQIISAHLAMIQDKGFIDKIKQKISNDLLNVESAVSSEINNMAHLLASVEDEYIRERVQDIKDIGGRVLRNLCPENHSRSFKFPCGSIVFAHELFPSDTLCLDRKNISAIITEKGGINGHTSILARAMGLPAISGIEGILKKVREGDPVQVDGNTGEIIHCPDAECVNSFSLRLKKQAEEKSKITNSLFSECQTTDGIKIFLYGNISTPSEIMDIHANNLEGVGLLRTEFLFFDVPETPSCDVQIPLYKKALNELDGLPLTVRILDLGGDKWPLFVSHNQAQNPYLGLRGLRYMLSEKDMLQTQVRSLLQTGYNKNLRIMFPMVIDSYDFNTAKDIIIMEAEKIGLEKLPEIGAMIETPSAIFQLDWLMKSADFISIGSNDLTQFILAADRNSPEMAGEYNVLHPAVLKAIKQIIDKAREYNCSVTICGEAAGNPRIAGLLVGLGLRNLSMSPIRAPAVRFSINSSSSTLLQDLALEAVSAESKHNVREIIDRAFPQ